MRREIELRCILFPLIILEMFLQQGWSPPVVNSIDRTWFGKALTCLYKVPQLTGHVREKYLPDQGPSPAFAQFGQTPSSRKSLGGSRLLPFKNDGGHCVLGDLQCCRNVLVPFPRSVPRHHPVSELYGQFLRPHGLVFALTWPVNCGTLYRQVCVFPNHVQSIEFTTGGLQSSCRNISRMINGNKMHLNSI